MSNRMTDLTDQSDDTRDGFSRRDFLRRSSLLALGLGGVGIAACDSGSDMEEGTEVAQTFTVTVEEISSSYPYSDQNQIGAAFTIDGQVGQELTLERGATYEFDLQPSVQSGPGGFPHPFYIDRTAEGQGADPYTEGVENGSSVTGTVRFTVPSDAPDTLFYQCGNHAYMGGMITITDSG